MNVVPFSVILIIILLVIYRFFTLQAVPVNDGLFLMKRTYGVGIDIPIGMSVLFLDRSPLKAYFSVAPSNTEETFAGIQIYSTLVPNNDTELHSNVKRFANSVSGIHVKGSQKTNIGSGKIPAILLDYALTIHNTKDNFIQQLAKKASLSHASTLHVKRYFFFRPNMCVGTIAFCSVESVISPLESEPRFADLLQSLHFVDYTSS